GASGGYGFTSDAQAETFAQTVWQSFMNGSSAVRPFGSAVIDGVDLDIEGGSTVGYGAFARKLRTLSAADRSRRWYITAAPQCPTPDAFLGPAAGRALGDSPQSFDYLFVQFYNNFCGYQDPAAFMTSFN